MAEDLDAERLDEIKESGETWLVDFWAEWCVAPETTVYANDASVPVTALQDEQHSVFSYNQVSEDLEKKKVSAVSKNRHDNLLRIETEAGRELALTPEHQVHTEQGWVEASQVTSGERVAVHPVTEETFDFPEEGVIVDESDVRAEASDRMRTDQYIRELEDNNLLSLSADQSETVILARLAGALFSDGSLSRNPSNNQRFVEFHLGTEEDAEELTDDMRALGFSPQVLHRETEPTFGDRTVTMETVRVRTSQTALFLLLRALGVPEGKKTDVEFEVPDWVMESTDGIKREFLRGYLGGDGPKPAIHRSERERKGDYNTFQINDLEFHKNQNLEENGIHFAHQIAELMEEFGVGIRSVESADRFEREDGTTSVKIVIGISDSLESFYQYAHVLDVAYARTKKRAFLRAGEYARKRLHKHRQVQQLKQKAEQMHEEGMMWKEIGERLGVNDVTVLGWVKHDKEPLPPNEQLYDDWLEERQCELGEEFLWERIESIEDVGDGETVSLEVEGTYNFIGNGILTHNCGPCKTMEPIVDELSEEMDDVSFGKVDVDENQELATSHGVRSIPTFIVLKDGEEVDRTMGAMNRDDFQEWIEENA